jgi:hypothetical protein
MKKWLCVPFFFFSSELLAQEAPYPIVDTGQVACYGARGPMACPQVGQAFYGQDGNYAGRQFSYRDNGDGTISDLATGLMWEKGFRKISWGQASADAAQARTGGHSDWRVPSIKELYSLINFNGSTGSVRPEMTGAPTDAKPYLDTKVFAFEYPSQGRYIDAQYVSSTAYLGIVMGRDRAFFGVNFADGRIKGYPQDGGPGGRQWYARYVRGNPAYGHNKFRDLGDGTIFDAASNLTWMKIDSGEASLRQQLSWSQARDGRLDWQEALRFCSTLDYAGKKDWRLPNAKELQSLIDYSQSPDGTGRAAIAPLFAITEIVDGNGRRDWPYFWSGTTHLDRRVMGEFAVYLAFGKAQGHIRPGGGPGGMGGMGPGGRMGPGMGGMGGSQQGLVLMDVHGAGAQRSSPKSGDESRLPVGHGPQGDVLRIYNYARCVRS